MAKSKSPTLFVLALVMLAATGCSAEREPEIPCIGNTYIILGALKAHERSFVEMEELIAQAKQKDSLGMLTETDIGKVKGAFIVTEGLRNLVDSLRNEMDASCGTTNREK
ncbi:MAG: hypothetical protein A2939_05775 [Parcubacteria group bacterium RIFCSPLOWO2_01_FULL_48_18]|nr:MAG: hypothetical protein A2939_05775 [Parcubacteria group bacterium RIFCSPLOWO2_01_FULL_48_18]OHB22583.1 MAG: hypothetical protein A3J67_00780 [Parcubacteria group bacterium RIFCSPHIGHO2_02_FULL_48_10b]